MATFHSVYDQHEEIGRGASGVVFRCTRKDDKKIKKTDFAVKDIDLRPLQLRENFDLKKLKTEVDIMTQLDHPNIIKLIEVYETDESLMLVMEYAPGMELFKAILRKTFFFIEAEAKPIFIQIANALKYLHANSIVHRDVKPENVFLLTKPYALKNGDKNNTLESEDRSMSIIERCDSQSPEGYRPFAKLLDFGLSKMIGEGQGGSAAKTFVGTPRYRAPEVEEVKAKPRPYDGTKADCWSLGVVLYVMLIGFFPEFTNADSGTKTLNMQSDQWNKISPLAKDLVANLMHSDPERRFNVAQALEHSWCRNYIYNSSDQVPSLNSGDSFEIRSFNVPGEFMHNNNVEALENPQNSLCSHSINKSSQLSESSTLGQDRNGKIEILTSSMKNLNDPLSGNGLHSYPSNSKENKGEKEIKENKKEEANAEENDTAWPPASKPIHKIFLHHRGNYENLTKRQDEEIEIDGESFRGWKGKIIIDEVFNDFLLFSGQKEEYEKISKFFFSDFNSYKKFEIKQATFNSWKEKYFPKNFQEQLSTQHFADNCYRKLFKFQGLKEFASYGWVKDFHIKKWNEVIEKQVQEKINKIELREEKKGLFDEICKLFKFQGLKEFASYGWVKDFHIKKWNEVIEKQVQEKINKIELREEKKKLFDEICKSGDEKAKGGLSLKRRRNNTVPARKNEEKEEEEEEETEERLREDVPEFKRQKLIQQPQHKIKYRVYGVDESEVETEGNCDIATSLNNIGNVYNNKGKYDEALVYSQKSLKIKYRVYGVDESEVETEGNCDIATSLNNIGNVYYNKGKYDGALVYYQKSLKIKYRVYGVDESEVETEGNSDIATSLNNIGWVYEDKGNYDEALVYYQKSLKIKYRVYGVDESEVETEGNCDIATSLHNIGSVYNKKGNYDEALVYYQKSLKIKYRVYGVDESEVETEGNSDIARSLHNIGNVYRSKGKYDEALVYYQKSLKIMYRVYGVDESEVETEGNCDIATSLNNIGNVYYNKGKYDGALVYYQKSLKIKYRVYGVDESEVETEGNCDIATSLNNIGNVYYNKGKYDEALVYSQKSLKIKYRVYGVDESEVETEGNSDIARSLHNIGSVYNKKGNYDEALVYYQKSLKIKYRVYGVDESEVETEGNSDIAISLDSIGIVYEDKGNYDEALVYSQKSLKIKYRVYGVDESEVETEGNCDIATSLNNIGNVYYNKGKYDGALVYYQKSLKIKYRVYGVDESEVETEGNCDIATSLNDIGNVYYNKGKYDEALVYYQKSLKIKYRVYGVDESEVETEGNSDIATSLNNIGWVYQQKGNYDEALVYSQKSLKIKYRVYGVDESEVETEGNSDIAISLDSIGNVYEDKGNYDEALVYYQKSLKIKYRVYGVDESEVETEGNSDIAISLDSIGNVYEDKGNYDEALVYYQKSLKIKYRV